MTTLATLLAASLAAAPAPIPQETVHASMVQVEPMLIALGYDVKGYAELTPPKAYVVSTLYTVNAAMSVLLGEIIISDRAPAGCLGVLLGHEVTHDVLARMLHISDARSEAAARSITETLEQNPYRPNCMKPPVNPLTNL